MLPKADYRPRGKRRSHAREGSGKKGLSLIEVLASIALLGVLLSATLVAIGRHTRQVRLAQDRLIALEVADGLLHQWLVQDGGRLEAEEGSVPDHPAWRWQVTGRIEPGIEHLGAHIGRVEIVKQRSAQEEEAVLASLEFVSTSPVTAGQLLQKGPFSAVTTYGAVGGAR